MKWPVHSHKKAMLQQPGQQPDPKQTNTRLSVCIQTRITTPDNPKRAHHSNARPTSELYKIKTASACRTNTGILSRCAHSCMPCMALHVRIQKKAQLLCLFSPHPEVIQSDAHIRNLRQSATEQLPHKTKTQTAAAAALFHSIAYNIWGEPTSQPMRACSTT